MSAVTIDRTSLLAEVDGATTLEACEARLRGEGLTLGVEIGERGGWTIGAWIDRGAPGARDPWIDPVDHLIAGLDALLGDGRVLSVRPAPRRAVGPDLIALVFGMEGRFARTMRAWLRVHPVDVVRPETHRLIADRGAALEDGEMRLLGEIERALRGGG